MTPNSEASGLTDDEIDRVIVTTPGNFRPSDDISFVRDVCRAAIAAHEAKRPSTSAEAVFETRADGKVVRKDRWQFCVRRIAALLWGNRREFECDEIVEAVRAALPSPKNDDEGLVRAALGMYSDYPAPATVAAGEAPILTGVFRRDGGHVAVVSAYGDTEVEACDELQFAASAFREAWGAANGVAPPTDPKAEPGDAIARSKRILALVDDYHDKPTNDTRHALRAALMDEFADPKADPDLLRRMAEVLSEAERALWRDSDAELCCRIDQLLKEAR